MICKAFEVRDEGTHISVLAIQLAPGNHREELILGRTGHMMLNEYHVVLMDLGNMPYPATIFPGNHPGGRTLKYVHDYIKRHFDVLDSGKVLDVQFLMGETDYPCRSELGRSDRDTGPEIRRSGSQEDQGQRHADG